MPTFSGFSTKGMQELGFGVLSLYEEAYVSMETGLQIPPKQVGILYMLNLSDGGTRERVCFRERLFAPNSNFNLDNALFERPGSVRFWANWNEDGIPWSLYFE